MSDVREVVVHTTVQRKHRDLAAFVVVPAEAIAAWGLQGTTTVRVTVDALDLGRRSLLCWDAHRWFVELRRDHLAVLGKTVGAAVTLRIRLASAELPQEPQALIDQDRPARASWERMSEARQRGLREEIDTARLPQTRQSRARRALPPEPPPPSPQHLGSEWRRVALAVVGDGLPGRQCEPYGEVRVGLGVSSGLEHVVPADVHEVTWETRFEVRDKGEGPRFRGPAVHGPAAERFLYLVWLGRLGDEAESSFRRAKLRLDAIPGEILAEAVRRGHLEARLGLTDAKGMPVCASVRPPAIHWRVK